VGYLDRYIINAERKSVNQYVSIELMAKLLFKFIYLKSYDNKKVDARRKVMTSLLDIILINREAILQMNGNERILNFWV
tara:strand:+ start:2122 stop:2358 length:237 start_codon:yes stop_codon:yes gene_type:complete